MSAELIVRPGKTIASRGDFISSHPRGCAIALDGYVHEPPFLEWTDEGPYANFDHHHGVERLATLSSAQQVLRAIRTGLVDAFMREGEYCPTVYVNDCDQDVVLAWYLLKFAPDIDARRVKKRGAPLRNLVDMAGDLDVTAGAYPYSPKLPLMRQIAWMFRPFTEARVEGALTRDADQYRDIIGQCCGRIALHLSGRGKDVRLDTRFRELGGGRNWRMIEEIGPEGRIGAFRNDIHAYIIHKGQRPDGRHDYTIGRISGYINFNVGRIVDHLNALEGLTGPDRWGCDGSEIIGGSPRGAGSGLSPEALIEITNDLSPTYAKS